MYLNVVQLAESFGVEESVIEGWVRDEGLPHVPERGRLLFDRPQVATWAAQRGLASKVGLLGPQPPAAHRGRATGGPHQGWNPRPRPPPTPERGPSSSRCCARAASGATSRAR